ncbi:MAG: zinc metalloprotease [Bellilinea sp.]
MDSPFLFKPGKPIVTVGRIFGTPLAFQGFSWLPLNQVFAWTLFTRQAMKDHADWTRWRHLLLGGLKMIVLLGSEWCHNIAHAAVARVVGQPVDSMRIIAGMPVLLYKEPEHPSVTPRQHILRSLGGPLCNAVLLLVSKLIQQITLPKSPAREVVNVAAGMNTFITFASLTPVPEFDGGPILKWSLISHGYSPERASRISIRANRLIGSGLLGASAVSIKNRRWLLALIFSFLGVLSLTAGYGRMKT